jgi:hypothetical protein
LPGRPLAATAIIWNSIFDARKPTRPRLLARAIRALFQVPGNTRTAPHHTAPPPLFPLGSASPYSERKHRWPRPAHALDPPFGRFRILAAGGLVVAHTEYSVDLKTLSAYGASVPSRIMLIATRVAEEGWPWMSSGAVTRQTSMVTSSFS